MKGHENGLDVWRFKFAEWEFKLATNGSEHAWDQGKVSPLNLKYFVGRQGNNEFEELPERMWFKQIDQMLAIMADIDINYPGKDVVSQ